MARKKQVADGQASLFDLPLEKAKAAEAAAKETATPTPVAKETAATPTPVAEMATTEVTKSETSHSATLATPETVAAAPKKAVAPDANKVNKTPEIAKKPKVQNSAKTTPKAKVKAQTNAKTAPKTEAQAQQPMTKMQRIEADLAKIDREPQETKLAQKYANDEAKAYANINTALENAAHALKIATLEFEGRADLNEQERKVQYRELIKNAKAAVKQIEPHNRMHVFIFKSATGSWWKMGGNSVAIHRLMVATYLDHEVNVNVDRDTFAVFRDGVICLQDARRLERDIAYSGAPLKLDDTIEFGPFTGVIIAYRLQKPLAEREVRRFRQLDAEVMKNINNNIFAASPEVDINNQLVICLREGFQLERQIDANARGFVGHQLMDSLWRMRRAYYDVANCGRKDPARFKAMERIETALGDAMSTLANYADLNVVNRSTIAKVSLGLAKLREMVSQKLHRSQGRYAMGEKLEELRGGATETTAGE